MRKHAQAARLETGCPFRMPAQAFMKEAPLTNKPVWHKSWAAIRMNQAAHFAAFAAAMPLMTRCSAVSDTRERIIYACEANRRNSKKIACDSQILTELGAKKDD